MILFGVCFLLYYFKLSAGIGFYTFLKSLRIYEENKKKYHNLVVSLYAIETHVTLCDKKFIF